MNHKTPAPIPEAITQLQRRLEEFHSAQPVRTKLPESLWEAAVELARQHGIYAVAHPLRLDYTRLKQRLGGNPSQGRKPEQPAFVELIGSNAATLPENGLCLRTPHGQALAAARRLREVGGHGQSTSVWQAARQSDILHFDIM